MNSEGSSYSRIRVNCSVYAVWPAISLATMRYSSSIVRFCAGIWAK